MVLYHIYALEAQNSRWAMLKALGAKRMYWTTGWTSRGGQVNASSMLNGGRTGVVGHGDDVGASSGATGTRRNVEVTECPGNHSDG